MVSLLKGSIKEVIEPQSILYGTLTNDLEKYKQSLPEHIPLLLGVIRKNGESEFLVGPNAHRTIKDKKFYCIDFYIATDPLTFSHITTLGKKEVSAEKESLIDCFDPLKESARVRFVLNCLKAKKENPAKFWLPKLVQERVVAQNEQEFRELISHIKETGTHTQFAEELVYHVFQIRPNPCREKADYFTWLGSLFSNGPQKDLVKATRHYQAALDADKNCLAAKIGLGQIAFSEKGKNLEVQKILLADFNSLNEDKKVRFIIDCLDKGAHTLAEVFIKTLLKNPKSVSVKELKTLLSQLKSRSLFIPLAEELIHRCYTKESTSKEKIRYFVWLGDVYRTGLKKTLKPDLAKAERYYLRVLVVIDPKNIEARVGYAKMLYCGELTGQREINRCLTTLEEALLIKKNHPAIHQLLGEIYMDGSGGRPKDYPKAEYHLQKCLKLDPTNLLAKRHLEIIQAHPIENQVDAEIALTKLSHLTEIGNALLTLRAVD